MDGPATLGLRVAQPGLGVHAQLTKPDERSQGLLVADATQPGSTSILGRYVYLDLKLLHHQQHQKYMVKLPMQNRGHLWEVPQSPLDSLTASNRFPGQLGSSLGLLDPLISSWEE